MEYRIEDQQEWRGAGESRLNFLTFSVCPSSSYVFRVLAVNMVGPSDYSESTSIDTPEKGTLSCHMCFAFLLTFLTF